MLREGHADTCLGLEQEVLQPDFNIKDILDPFGGVKPRFPRQARDTEFIEVQGQP